MLCDSEKAGRTRDSHDGTLPTLNHPGENRARHPVQSECVDLVRATNVVLGRIQQVLPRDDSCVVDEHIDDPAALGDTIDDGDLGDVNDVRFRRPARSDDLVSHTFGRVAVTVPDDDVRTALGGLNTDQIEKLLKSSIGLAQTTANPSYMNACLLYTSDAADD